MKHPAEKLSVYRRGSDVGLAVVRRSGMEQCFSFGGLGVYWLDATVCALRLVLLNVQMSDKLADWNLCTQPTV